MALACAELELKVGVETLADEQVFDCLHQQLSTVVTVSMSCSLHDAKFICTEHWYHSISLAHAVWVLVNRRQWLLQLPH